MASRGNLYVRSDYVHGGKWTNYNRNAIVGGQITMAKEKAELLNIFFGIFLVFAEKGLWDLITFWCFRLKRRRRTPRRRDALFHQQQTVLRNGGTPISIALAYGQMWKAWGFHTPEVIMSTLPLIVAATVSFALFLAALPFITALVLLDNQGDEVLIWSPNCGFWAAVYTDADSYTTASTIMTNQSFQAVTYVDNCYESDAPSSLCDKFLPRRRLPTFEWSAAPCPFYEEVCLHTNNYPAFKMQTEVLDSHKDLGINSPLKDRIKLQRTTVCSPLNVTRFTNITSGVVLGEEITGVYFGPATTGVEYTFGVSNYEKIATSGYHLSAAWSYPANGTTYSATFTPIEALTRQDADVSIVFFNNNNIPIQGIDGPCSDPFFSATNQSLLKDKNSYLPDNPITAIGCIDQYAFGNPVTNQWTEPVPVGTDWANYTKDWDLSARQVGTLTTIAWALSEIGGIDRVILGLETEALLAKKYPGIFLGLQNPIPNNQWKKEVDYWFKNGLAKLQLYLINIAIGPLDPTLPGLQNLLPIISADRDDMVEMICSSQKVHNVEFKNYNFAGFIAIVAIGGFLILFPVPVRYFYTWYRKDREDILVWNSYAPLQLLRMVMEGAGVGDWRNCDNDVPYLDELHSPAGDLHVAEGGVGPAHPVWMLVQTQADAERPAAGDDGSPEAQGLLGQSSSVAGSEQGQELNDLGGEAAARPVTQVRA